MKLHDIKANSGSRKPKVRKGRGDSSGSGNYSGRGMKGQNSRAGGGVRLGFEGGQTPLLRRTPKLKGFKNPNRVEYVVINLDKIEARYADGEVVSPTSLFEKRLVAKAGLPIKILGNGTLTKKVTFEYVKMSKVVEKASASAPKKPAAKKEETTKKEEASSE